MNPKRRETITAKLGHAAVLTVPETAELLKTSQWTIYKLLRERQLGSIRIGSRRLIPVADFQAFIESRRDPIQYGGGHVA
ncbi:MAG: helix-turn-helix domain-containing protein [Actinomycetia bacterium]|nr:helix-turn-helix domain-containing protein [Actinomycetes bacterium]